MNENQIYAGFLKAALYEGLTLPEANLLFKKAGPVFKPAKLTPRASKKFMSKSAPKATKAEAPKAEAPKAESPDIMGAPTGAGKAVSPDLMGGSTGGLPPLPAITAGAAPNMPVAINPNPMPAPIPGAAGLNGAKGIDPKILSALAGVAGVGAGATAGAAGMQAAHTGIEDQLAQAAQSMAQTPLPKPEAGGIPTWAALLGGAGLGAGAGLAMAPTEDRKNKGQQPAGLPPLPAI